MPGIPWAELLRAASRIIKKMGTDLSRSINDAVIRRLAGAQSYQRGLDYSSHGRVESLEETTTTP
jgi:uncharacterized Zn finger protein